MSESKRVEFKTRDGTTLGGDFYQAAGDGVGIVVMLNGLNLPKEAFNSEFAKRFQAPGISALNYDNRGYGSSDGMPRQEVDLIRQAADFHDAISAAMNLPGVDPDKVIMWGIGHGASVAMISAGDDPRIRAVVMHAAFPSGRWDAAGFPEGTLARAWKERAEKTKAGDTTPTYVKVIRDWAEDHEGDDASVMIKGKMAHMLFSVADGSAKTAGTDWTNEMTLHSFINVASTEPMDYAHKISQRALYIVHQDDPFSPSPEFHRRVYARMGNSVDLKVIGSEGTAHFGEVLDKAITYQIDWMKSVL